MKTAAATRRRLYLVDAHAYLHRAYHALPPLTNSKKEPVGALLGFLRALLVIIRRDKPELLAVCFDAPGPTFRHKELESYKATRKPTEPDLKWQLNAARDVVKATGLPFVEAPGWEADDLMATLAAKGEAEGLDVVLVSGDKDALQLVGGRIRVLNEAKGVVFDPAKVEEKFKVTPAQLVDYLTLTGDVSDNVPGVPGVGAVGAAKLLNRFGDLDALIQAALKGDPDIPARIAKSLVDSQEAVRVGRRLITLDRNAPVPFAPGDCRYDFGKGPASEALLECLRRYEFNALLKELGGSPAPAPESAAPAAAPVRAAAFKKVDAEGLVKKVQKAGALALAASVPAQPDLLDPATVTVGAASEEGEAALFPEKPAKARAALGALLESGKALAVAHDVKALRQLLAQGGLSLRGPCFDTFLAAYCLNPSRGKYPLSAALEEAGAAPSEAGPAGEAAALWSLRGWQEAQLEAKGLSKLYRELELPLLDVLAAMEEAGIAVDVPYLERLKKEFESAIAALKKEMDGLAGAELNVNSPKQLAKLFYEDLKLPVLRKTATGAPSTDEESLQALADKHPLPAKIIEYRELAKLKSTYIEALLAKADKAGRVHTHFNQAGAATGRLSSIDPNLQNIPVRTALGQKIRRAFVAEKGQVLLSADYSQIDLRVLAHLSADPALCEAFRAGGDIHLRTAAEVFGVPPEEVDKEMRRRAKAVNFGIVYGQGPFALGQQLGIPFGEAKRYIELYFKRYAGVSAWTEANLESARKEGLVRTLLGRIRYVPDIAGKGPLRAAAERVAGNTPIQGGSADIIKAAMVAIHRKLPKSGFDARMILQVHDELLFELPKKEAPAFGKWVRREMEHAVELKVPVVVDLKAGPNWADMEALTA